jgi:pimeloyl-ACP methyl ester carboxylesterase
LVPPSSRREQLSGPIFRTTPPPIRATRRESVQRTGFQGGLNWYRSRSGGAFESELQLFAGRTIDVPSIFISGTSDWGVYQRPGAVERMQDTACSRFAGCHLLDGAGHWVQQEHPARVSEVLLDFLKAHAV